MLYRVTGIVQAQIGGDWGEYPTITTVWAHDRAAAPAAALASWRQTHQLDPLAIVRWHSPELLQIRPAPEAR